MSLSQIKLCLPNINITDIKEDENIESQVKDLASFRGNDIDWTGNEDDDISKRTQSIILKTKELLESKKDDRKYGFKCDLTILSSVELVKSDSSIELAGIQGQLKKKRSIRASSSPA